MDRGTARARASGATVQRTLAVLEDTEIAVLARDGGNRVLQDRSHRAGRRPGGGRGDDGAAAARSIISHGTRRVIAPRLLVAGTHDDRAYIEMELIRGVDAAVAASEHRTHEGEAGRRAALDFVRRIARAYADLHKRGVLHGDVHPRNILIEASGTVRLVDFGVASSVASAEMLPTSAARGGIPFFFEPELARASLARLRCQPRSTANSTVLPQSCGCSSRAIIVSSLGSVARPCSKTSRTAH